MSIKQTILSKAKTKKKNGVDEGGGDVDEKGSPLPIKNPEGGNPICPGGWKIDDDFDILDPLDPPFRCISALKDTSDGISKMMNKINNPASGVTDIAKSAIPRNAPAAGGSRKRIIRRRRRSTRLHRSNQRKHITHRRNKK
jgi:hypothetical protein